MTDGVSRPWAGLCESAGPLSFDVHMARISWQEAALNAGARMQVSWGVSTDAVQLSVYMQADIDLRHKWSFGGLCTLCMLLSGAGAVLCRVAACACTAGMTSHAGHGRSSILAIQHGWLLECVFWQTGMLPGHVGLPRVMPAWLWRGGMLPGSLTLACIACYACIPTLRHASVPCNMLQ